MKTVWGLTGGIGTGKSTVLDIFAKYDDVLTIKTDDLAKEILKRPEVTSKVTQLLGKEILSGDVIENSRLAEIVFTNPEALKNLEAIIHPLVWKEVDKITSSTDDEISFVLVESAIIFERNYQSRFKGVIATVCPSDFQLFRVMYRGVSRNEAKRRVDSQFPIEKIADLADMLIATDGSWWSVKKQVDYIYLRIKEENNG